MPFPMEHHAQPDDPARRRIAVIDIGSNSMRLVVYDRLNRVPTALFNEKVMCGLGRTVEKTGRLNPSGVSQALEGIMRFRWLVDAMQVSQVDVVATAAVREAEDGPGFVREIERRTGFTVRIIPGDEEARLSALGVLAGTPQADGVMGDLGGGSLELVDLRQGAIGDHCVSLPLGPLRLAEATGGNVAAAGALIDARIAAEPWILNYSGRDFYPVGGSWRALAKLHMEQTNHPLHIIHHYAVDAAGLEDFLTLVARMGSSSLGKLGGVSRRRLETLPYAALVMARVLRAIRPSQVVFSAHGLREGLLFDRLGPEERRDDPLIAACMELAGRMGRFGASRILSEWTEVLFPGEGAGEARLREAACLLSDMGWSEHPDYRAEHTYLRVLRMPIPGLDHTERAYIALAIFIRYGGKLGDPLIQDMRRLVGEEATARAAILGAALRLAQTLTGGALGCLRRVRLELEDEKVTLVIPEDAAALVGGSVQRRLDGLAKHLNRSGQIVYQPRPQAA